MVVGGNSKTATEAVGAIPGSWQVLADPLGRATWGRRGKITQYPLKARMIGEASSLPAPMGVGGLLGEVTVS